MRDHLPDPIAPGGPSFGAGWPQLGLGGAALGDLFQSVEEAEAQALLADAWDAGIRYYDTAPWYGHGLSEHRMGTMLRQHDRRDFKLSTKVGRVYAPAPRGADVRQQWVGGLNFSLRFDYSATGFEASLEQSRLRLGLSSVDALVIHDLDEPYHGKDMDRHVGDLMGSGLSWLHGRKAAGELAAIGMGINRIEEFERFAGEIDVDFFIVAMPYTLLDQRSLHGPMARCVEKGVRVVIGAPFASGLLTNPSAEGATYAYRPADEEIKAKALAIEAVCKRHGVSLPAAALRFPLLHPAVISVIPGAAAAAHVRVNAAAMAETIPPALWGELKAEGLIDADAPTGA